MLSRTAVRVLGLTAEEATATAKGRVVQCEKYGAGETTETTDEKVGTDRGEEDGKSQPDYDAVVCSDG